MPRCLVQVWPWNKAIQTIQELTECHNRWSAQTGLASSFEGGNLAPRGTKQTRHTFATISLSSGEDPLWVAKVMGHCNTEMIHRFYARYVKNVKGGQDGSKISALLDPVGLGKNE